MEMHTRAFSGFFLAGFIIFDPLFCVGLICLLCFVNFILIIFPCFRVFFIFRDRDELRCRMSVTIGLFIMIIFRDICFNVTVFICRIRIHFTEIIPGDRRWCIAGLPVLTRVFSGFRAFIKFNTSIVIRIDLILIIEFLIKGEHGTFQRGLLRAHFIIVLI